MCLYVCPSEREREREREREMLLSDRRSQKMQKVENWESETFLQS